MEYLGQASSDLALLFIHLNQIEKLPEIKPPLVIPEIFKSATFKLPLSNLDC